jgi:hypothetical protein
MQEIEYGAGDICKDGNSNGVCDFSGKQINNNQIGTDHEYPECN